MSGEVVANCYYMLPLCWAGHVCHSSQPSAVSDRLQKQPCPPTDRGLTGPRIRPLTIRLFEKHRGRRKCWIVWRPPAGQLLLLLLLLLPWECLPLGVLPNRPLAVSPQSRATIATSRPGFVDGGGCRAADGNCLPPVWVLWAWLVPLPTVAVVVVVWLDRFLGWLLVAGGVVVIGSLGGWCWCRLLALPRIVGVCSVGRTTSLARLLCHPFAAVVGWAGGGRVGPPASG